MKRRSALWLPFVVLHVAGVAGHDWRGLAIIDGAVLGLLALGLVATRIWPDSAGP